MAGEGQAIAKAFVSLGLNWKDIDKDLKQARSVVAKGVGALGSVFKNPFMAWNLSNTFTDFFKTYLAEAQDMKRFSGLVGTSVEEFSKWGAAAATFGIDTKTLADALTDLNDKMTDYAKNGSGPFEEIANIQGFSFRDESGNLLPTLNVLENISDTAKGLGTQGGVGLLKRLGFNDPNLLAMMMNTEKSLKDIIREAGKNAIYSEDDAKSAAEMTKNLREAARVIRMTVMPWAAALAKALAVLSRHMEILTPLVILCADALGARFAPAVGKALSVFAANWKFLTGFGAMLFLIGAAVEDLVKWANGSKKTAFGGVWESIFGSRKNAEEFIATVKKFAPVILFAVAALRTFGPTLAAMGVISKISGFLSSMFSLIKAGIPVLIKFGMAAWTAFGPWGIAIGAVIAGIALLIAYWDEVREAGINALNFLSNKATEWGNSLSSTIQNVKNWWNETCETLSSAWETAVNSWKAAFDNVFGGIIDSVKSIGHWLGFTDGDVKLASGGEGNSTISNNVEASQINNIYVNGEASKEAIGNAVAGATDNGLVSSYNY